MLLHCCPDQAWSAQLLEAQQDRSWNSIRPCADSVAEQAQCEPGKWPRYSTGSDQCRCSRTSRETEKSTGVRDVALSTSAPLTGHGSLPVVIAGQATTDTNKPVADFEIVTPGYFNTFGIRLERGRLINDDDNRTSSQVEMVNESFANHYLLGTDPLEQRVLVAQILPHGKLGAPIEYQIVGVFHDVLNGEHPTDQPFPEIFAPFLANSLAELCGGCAQCDRSSSDDERSAQHSCDGSAGMLLGPVRTMDKVVATQLTGWTLKHAAVWRICWPCVVTGTGDLRHHGIRCGAEDAADWASHGSRHTAASGGEVDGEGRYEAGADRRRDRACGRLRARQIDA